MKYLLAIDEGTSSTRAMLYQTDGTLLSMCQESLAQSYPRPGWVEQSPDEIWQKTLTVIKAVTASVDPKQVLACGITNQRETTVLWNRQTGQCLYSAIVWQDRRTEEYCHSLHDVRDTIRQKTGLLPDAYFSASKLHWLLDNIPEARSLAEKNQLAFGTIDSFLLWRLTRGQVHATDVTNASRTLLFDIVNRCWDNDLLSLFNIPRSILPDVRACDAEFGFIDSEYLGSPIPITGIAGDQQAALAGQHCFDPGMVKATYGTGGFLLMNTGSQPVLSKNGLLTTIACQVQNEVTYGLEGSLYHAGSTIKWLRDTMKLLSSAAETESMAVSLPSNEGVYFVPSFTGLGAPYWLENTGAMIMGLSRQSSPAHFARAALESVCYQTRDVLRCMKEDSNIQTPSLRVDGGMTSNHWMLQFLATQCQLTVQKPFNIETTGLGAAMLAALGCGEISSLKGADFGWQCDKELNPIPDEGRRDKDYEGWVKALRMLKAG
ncbi:glycerol kinase GlpK [Legionella sp. CNM-4043-24]|uniref:glycerol kinase GlpK n=1 Tax=Legionella sp. CNM-4043-24 TaxID=3421646 RepID=UPI00403AAAE9